MFPARWLSWSVAAPDLCVRPLTGSSRPSGRSPLRCSQVAAARGAARALLTLAVPPHLMRRCGARPPLLCGGGSFSQRGARRGLWRRVLSASSRWQGRRVFRGGRRRAALVAMIHEASLLRFSRPPFRRIRCSSAVAVRVLSAVRVVVSGGARSLSAAADRVVASFGAAAAALLSRCRRTRRRRSLFTSAVPPHPMRRCGARPLLLCRGGSCSQCGARRGRWRRVLSACGRWRGRRVLRGGRRRAAL